MSQAAGARRRLASLQGMPEGERLGVILDALEDEAPLVREEAVRYAARYLEPARLVRLVANDERAVLRNSAIAALERQGPYAVPPLEQVLAGPVDPDLAMFTLQVLARIADSTSTEAVLPWVRHANPNVAQAAIEALGAFRAAGAVPDLVAVMGGNLWLQLAAVNALGEIGDARAAIPLLELAPDSLLAIPALEALGKLPAAAVAVPLAELVRDVREPASREAALLALARVAIRNPADPALTGALETIASAAGEPTLVRMLDGALGSQSAAEGATHLRVAAATIAAAAPVPSLWAPALSALAASTEAAVLRGLLQSRQTSVGALAAQCLRDGDVAARAALLEFGTAAMVSPAMLLDALQDAHAGIRLAACRALGPLHAPEAVAPLIELLERGGEDERAAAAAALACQPAARLGGLASCLAPLSRLGNSCRPSVSSRPPAVSFMPNGCWSWPSTTPQPSAAPRSASSRTCATGGSSPCSSSHWPMSIPRCRWRRSNSWWNEAANAPWTSSWPCSRCPTPSASGSFGPSGACR